MPFLLGQKDSNTKTGLAIADQEMVDGVVEGFLSTWGVPFTPRQFDNWAKDEKGVKFMPDELGALFNRLIIEGRLVIDSIGRLGACVLVTHKTTA